MKSIGKSERKKTREPVGKFVKPFICLRHEYDRGEDKGEGKVMTQGGS